MECVMTEEKKTDAEPTAVAGSASIVESPALRVSHVNSDEVEKRAASYTASPVARTEKPEPPNTDE